jgi:hypothetical protein
MNADTRKTTGHLVGGLFSFDFANSQQPRANS